VLTKDHTALLVSRILIHKWNEQSCQCSARTLNFELCICLFVAATFIALRSIVPVEILGIQKLTNAFGLTVLFQGIAVLLGSPISGTFSPF